MMGRLGTSRRLGATRKRSRSKPKSLFVANLRRKGAGPGKAFTQAQSPEQARRFIHVRNPGYRITRLRRE